MTYNQYNGSFQNQYGQQPFYGKGNAGGYFPAYGMPQAPAVSPQTGPMIPGTGAVPSGPEVPGMLPLEQSYIENILRLNKGKLATVYALFDTASNNGGFFREFRGIIEAAGRDHLILSDPETGMRILLPMVYFGYATFEEELEYSYPFNGQFQGLTTYSPR